MSNHPDPVVDTHPDIDAVVTAGLGFVSGSLPLCEDARATGGRRDALDEATALARRGLGTVGARLEGVAQVTYLPTDVSLRDEANEQLCRPWPSPRPACTVVDVSGLPHGAVVETDIMGRAG